MNTSRPRRNTRQRQVILEELRKVKTHPTAFELCDMARKRLPKISLATVYRNLELLAADGTVQKLDFGGAQSRYDGNATSHCHVRCLRCGKLADLDGEQVKMPTDGCPSLSGYDIVGYQFEFIGICPDCGGASDEEDD